MRLGKFFLLMYVLAEDRADDKKEHNCEHVVTIKLVKKHNERLGGSRFVFFCGAKPVRQSVPHYRYNLRVYTAIIVCTLIVSFVYCCVQVFIVCAGLL